MQLVKRTYILLFSIASLAAKAQSDTTLILSKQLYDSEQKDTTKWKDLDPIKVSFLYSYYEQDGIHSPVTGGIGDEALKDNIGKITVNIPVKKWMDVSFMVGVDQYSSASTDNINNEHDLFIETSASYVDKRKYGDLGLAFNSEKRGIDFGFNGGYSTEWDVVSYNASAYFAKTSKNKNTQLKIKGVYYNDNWELIYPTELRPTDGSELLDVNVKELYDLSITWSQIINKKWQLSLSAEGVYQKGLLSTPFHRVYFKNGEHDIEHLPKQRLKLPLGVFSNWYLNDYAVLRLYYRWYIDNWGVLGNTMQLELPIKVKGPYLVMPFYRFHIQTEAKYFRDFERANVEDVFYTSDYDLSSFYTQKIGLGFRYSPLFGFTNKQKKRTKKQLIKFKSVSIRASKYFRFDYSGITLKAFVTTGVVNFEIK